MNNRSTLGRVLALTDFSAPARRAVDRAAMLALACGARLDLLHVLTGGAIDRLRRFAGADSAHTEQRLADAARAQLAQVGESLQRQRGITAEAHLGQGALLGVLDEQLNRLAPDLTVLGARGESYLRHAILGSTAERMLRKMSRPTLVVKQQPHEPYRRVLVPVDFSAASLPAIRLAQAVAPGAEIVLLHAFEVPFESKLQFAGVDDGVIEGYRQTARQEAVLQLRDLAEDAGCASGSRVMLVLHGPAARHIVEQQQEQDCDLIIMGKHGEGMIEALLLGSVTKHVLAESQGDVLVCA